MKKINNTKKEWLLQIHLLQDIEPLMFQCDVDGERRQIFLSNQGKYFMDLKVFSVLDYPFLSNCKYSFIEKKQKYSQIMKDYADSLLSTDVVISNFSEDVYGRFQTLLYRSKEAIRSGDTLQISSLMSELETAIVETYPLKNYQGNWWIYEIGIPKCINEMIFLFHNELSSYEKDRYLSIEMFYLPSCEYLFYRRNFPETFREKSNYANLSDMIYICLLRAICWSDEPTISELSQKIGEIWKMTSEGDGFYSDGGFLYHRYFPYTASYGEVLLESYAKNVELLTLAGYDCTSHIQIAYERILKSYVPFLYRNRALNCVRGRAISRPRNEKYSYTKILSSIERLVKLYPSSDIERFLKKERSGEYDSKAYAFNSMNRYLQRTPQYLIAISSHSDRIATYEQMNGENLSGSYSSNFIYEIYQNDDKVCSSVLMRNPFYRPGSTNQIHYQAPNQPTNSLSDGVAVKNLLSVFYLSDEEVKGHFSKFVLDHSLVCVGSHIRSVNRYVSTICEYEGNFEKENNSFSFGSSKVILHQEALIEQGVECRSWQDINLSEPADKHRFFVSRLVLHQPEEYHYQVYPVSSDEEDFYDLRISDDVHFMKYQNYVLISSFSMKEQRIENYCFSGIFSAIAEKVSETEIHLTFCCAHPSVCFQITGFSSLADDKEWTPHEIYRKEFRKK